MGTRAREDGRLGTWQRGDAERLRYLLHIELVQDAVDRILAASHPCNFLCTVAPEGLPGACNCYHHSPVGCAVVCSRRSLRRTFQRTPRAFPEHREAGHAAQIYQPKHQEGPPALPSRLYHAAGYCLLWHTYSTCTLNAHAFDTRAQRSARMRETERQSL